MGKMWSVDQGNDVKLRIRLGQMALKDGWLTRTAARSLQKVRPAPSQVIHSMVNLENQRQRVRSQQLAAPSHAEWWLICGSERKQASEPREGGTDRQGTAVVQFVAQPTSEQRNDMWLGSRDWARDNDSPGTGSGAGIGVCNNATSLTLS
ncbi:uncharacterized protein CIMG_03959 [Coccidioides immitis RS]|uniref:Uncharacterized protein n=1 Tax=Coccidioides immitis (strain RS) TaxID=246410 RepID=J3KCH0_COCIM|nr:uncharacterized protein CIMG_03959 [Coccidioides immitis RS]EAS32935.3 hypothetical protein CIMG_03959 [Coccidioides immitis RS]